MSIQSGFSPSLSTFTIFDFIEEAFARIGIPNEKIEYQKIQAALKSFSFLMMEWMNFEIYLWTIKRDILPLCWKKSKYELSSSVFNIIQASLKPSSLTKSYTPYALNYLRNLDEKASCSSPHEIDDFDLNAEKAFDLNPETQCILESVAGFISYNFGKITESKISLPKIEDVYQTVRFVHVTIGSDDDKIAKKHHLKFKTVDSTGTDIVVFDTGVKTFIKGERNTFQIPYPISGTSFSVNQEEEEGLDALVIQEIIVEKYCQPTPLTLMSRYDYELVQGRVDSRPSTYYLDQQPTPILNVYPTPSDDTCIILYSYLKKPDDITSINDNLAIPSQFYNAAVWGLSLALAIKFMPDKIDMAESAYNSSLSKASFRNKEDVNYKITFDMSRYRNR